MTDRQPALRVVGGTDRPGKPMYDNVVRTVFRPNGPLAGLDPEFKAAIEKLIFFCIDIGAGRTSDPSSIPFQTLEHIQRVMSCVLPESSDSFASSIPAEYKKIRDGVGELFDRLADLSATYSADEARCNEIVGQLSTELLKTAHETLIAEAKLLTFRINGETSVPQFAVAHPSIERLKKIHAQLTAEDTEITADLERIAASVTKGPTDLRCLSSARDAFLGEINWYHRMARRVNLTLLTPPEIETYAGSKYQADSIQFMLNATDGELQRCTQRAACAEELHKLRSTMIKRETDAIANALSLWDDAPLHQEASRVTDQIHAIVYSMCHASTLFTETSTQIPNKAVNIAYSLVDILGTSKDECLEEILRNLSTLVALSLVNHSKDAASITPTQKAFVWFHSGKSRPKDLWRKNIEQLWREKRDTGSFKREHSGLPAVQLMSQLSPYQKTVLAAIHTGFAKFEPPPSATWFDVISAITAISVFSDITITALESQFMALAQGGPTRQTVRITKATLTLTEVGTILGKECSSALPSEYHADVWVLLHEPSDRAKSFKKRLTDMFK